MTEARALLDENMCSLPSPSLSPAPPFMLIRWLSWHNLLCAVLWKEPVQLLKLVDWVRLLIDDFERVAVNVHPTSYAKRILSPNV